MLLLHLAIGSSVSSSIFFVNVSLIPSNLLLRRFTTLLTGLTGNFVLAIIKKVVVLSFFCFLNVFFCTAWFWFLMSRFVSVSGSLRDVFPSMMFLAFLRINHRCSPNPLSNPKTTHQTHFCHDDSWSQELHFCFYFQISGPEFQLVVFAGFLLSPNSCNFLIFFSC